MLFLLCSYLHPGSWRPATPKSKTPPAGEVYLVVGREYHWEYNPFLIQSAVHTIFTPILSAYKGRENLLLQEKIKQLIAPTLYSRSRQPGLQSKIGIETKLQYFKTLGYYSLFQPSAGLAPFGSKYGKRHEHKRRKFKPVVWSLVWNCSLNKACIIRLINSCFWKLRNVWIRKCLNYSAFYWNYSQNIKCITSQQKKKHSQIYMRYLQGSLPILKYV